MGLFDLFGGKKNAADVEAEALKDAAQKKEQEIQAAREAHADMEWPGFPRLNPINISTDEVVMIETVSAERKDEIGDMIYDSDIAPETLRFLSNQEILFLLTALEVYNKKAALPGFEKNHRKVYNELLSRIRDAEMLYVLYDASTGYPFVDHGFANVYFEKEIADKAVELFGKQFRKVAAREIKVENPDDTAAVKRGFFDYLYYIGIENLLVDNGAYRARFKRSEIVAAPFEWNEADKAKHPINPALNFAMIDFLAELRWHVQYEKRDEIVRAKEMRMLSLIRSSNFIIPMQHEGPVEVLEDGRMKFNKDTKFKFLIMNTQDGKQFLPVFTDAIEFGKKLRGSEWNAAVFKYQDILKFCNDKDGMTINPDGQNVVLPKDRMMIIEVAGQNADRMRGIKKPETTVPAGNSDDAAIQKALGEALAKMNDNE